MITKEKIDEAIKHCEEVAEEKRYEYQECLAVHDMENAMVCGKCGEEYEQLAEWLKELKKFREQKPCEDAISRKVVLEWIKGSLEQYANTYSNDMLNMWKLFEEQIKALPPVTPQQKKGHWKWEEDWTPSTPVSPAECNYAGWVCSECGEFPDEYTDWDNPDEKPTYDYCPNCGTEMRDKECQ